MSKENCPECEFLKGSSDENVFNPDLLIMENDAFAAYYASKPVIQGHVVILPKKHYFRLIEITPKEWAQFGELTQTIGVAGSFRSFHLLTPSGIEFGKHLVLHILPSGRERFDYPWEPKDLSHDELNGLQLRVQETIQKMPIEGRAIILNPDMPRSSSIPFKEIMPGMPCLLHGMRHNCEYAPPRDAIPPIYNPKFIDPSEVDYLKDDDTIASVTIDGETRAYPINILDYHEIVCDNIRETYFVVSYCPLCASSLVFNQQLSPNNAPTRFGVSGFLYQSDLLMFDHETESLWSQIEGKCIYGKYEGKDLDLIPFEVVSWKKWKKIHPNGKTLSKDTGFDRDYTHFPYGEYNIKDMTIFPVQKKDERSRLHPKTMIYGIESNGIAKAYPEDFLFDQRMIVDVVGNTSLAIVLDESDGVVALVPEIDGIALSFERTDAGLIDNETGTQWTYRGKGIEGKYVGRQLQRRPDLLRMFYFAWVAFNPHAEVEIFQNIHEEPSWKERFFRKFRKTA